MYFDALLCSDVAMFPDLSNNCYDDIVLYTYYPSHKSILKIYFQEVNINPAVYRVILMTV